MRKFDFVAQIPNTMVQTEAADNTILVTCMETSGGDAGFMGEHPSTSRTRCVKTRSGSIIAILVIGMGK